MHNTALAKLLPKNKAQLYKGVATNALGWALPSVFRWNRIVQVMKYRFNILRLVAFFYLQTNHLSLGGKRPQERLSWNLVVKALIIARQQKVMPTQGNSSSFLWKEGAVLGLVDLFALPCLSTSLPSCWDMLATWSCPWCSRVLTFAYKIYTCFVLGNFGGGCLPICYYIQSVKFKGVICLLCWTSTCWVALVYQSLKRLPRLQSVMSWNRS